MFNYLLTIEYEGTRYKGFSNPKSSNTVSDHLFSALSRFAGCDETEIAVGVKTEPGVHAIHQTVNFHTEQSLDEAKLMKELNDGLPQDIAVREVRRVSERFHSSLNLKECTYLYKIDTGRYASVFKRNHSVHAAGIPDTDRMDKCAKCLIGKHDFKNFCNLRKKKNTIHTITELTLIKDEENEELLLKMSADRFLKGMPLMIADLLIKAGRGEIDENEVKKALEADSYPFSSVFAGGLYLLDTTYL